MSIESLVRESEKLVEFLDPIVEDIADIRLQRVADSAWYRLSVVNVLIRDAGGGALAATLARSLIEQAAYWDWALATGVSVDHLDQWAALELDGLRRLAGDAEDEVWLGWLLPPGVSVAAAAGSRHTEECRRRRSADRLRSGWCCAQPAGVRWAVVGVPGP